MQIGFLAQYKLIQLNQSQYYSLSGQNDTNQTNQAWQRANTTRKAIALPDYQSCLMERLAECGYYTLTIDFMLK